MKLVFEDMELSTIPNFKGGLGKMDAHMHVDSNNKILLAKLDPQSTVGLHEHGSSSEIIIVVSGMGMHVVDGVSELLEAGQCGYCPQGSTHELSVVGEDPLVFYAIVPEHQQ